MEIPEVVMEEIRQEYADGVQMHEIAKLFNLPESIVRYIIMRGDDQKD